MSDEDDDGAGYRKPPKHSQFKKGQSGNPSGRRPGSRNFKTDLERVLNAPVTVNENGQPTEVSTQLAVMMRLREKALKGDPRALEKMLSLAAERSADQEAHAAERALTESEDDILAVVA